MTHQPDGERAETLIKASNLADLHAAQEEWLTAEYIADHLAVSRKQVYRWMKAGQLGELLRLGRKAVRVKRENFQAFVELRKSA